MPLDVAGMVVVTVAQECTVLRGYQVTESCFLFSSVVDR